MNGQVRSIPWRLDAVTDRRTDGQKSRTIQWKYPKNKFKKFEITFGIQNLDWLGPKSNQNSDQNPTGILIFSWVTVTYKTSNEFLIDCGQLHAAFLKSYCYVDRFSNAGLNKRVFEVKSLKDYWKSYYIVRYLFSDKKF
jgi:hypothetical protein